MRTKNEACPRCRSNGGDNRGDNLVTYSDGGGHCFACGYHVFPKGLVRKVVVDGTKNEGPLPRDFTREVPAMAWRWLLQYGLPYSYWKDYTGYSPSTERLILTHGSPTEVSVGRYVGSDAGEGTREPPKWRMWGDRLRTGTILEGPTGCSDEIVLVEDLVSAHKVRGVTSAIPLFGTMITPKVLQTLMPLKRPVALWLDLDQWGYLPPKLNRLQTFLDAPVRFVRTEKDPKKYSLDEIKEILK
jgi:hypothetical protein